jgi:hypothetical protein
VCEGITPGETFATTEAKRLDGRLVKKCQPVSWISEQRYRDTTAFSKTYPLGGPKLKLDERFGLNECIGLYAPLENQSRWR